MSEKSIKKSLFWKLLEKILVQGVNLLVQIILARILFPEDFGNLAIIVAIINYAAIFVQSGVSTVIIRQKEINDKDISTLFISSITFALFLYVLLFFLSPLISHFYKTDELIWPLRVLSIILFLNSINAIQIGIYSRNMEFKKMFIRSVIAVPISGAVGIFMAIKGFGLWSLVVHNLLNMFLIIVIMAFDKTTRFKISFSFSSFKKLYSFTSKIILTGVITGGSDLLRTLIIGREYSSEELAYFDKAYTYSNYATQIAGQSVTSVMLPSFSKVRENKDQLKDLARRSISMSAFVMFPILLGVAAISRPFVLTVLTDKWEPCIPFLMVFCVLRMPSFISSIDKQVYYAVGKSEINLFYELAFLVCNISALLICLRLGVIWIAVGIAVVEWLGCLSLFFVSSKIYGYILLERLKDTWKPLVSSILMFSACYITGFFIDNLIIKLAIEIVIGIVVYFGLSLLFKDDNLFIILKMFRRRKKDD